MKLLRSSEMSLQIYRSFLRSFRRRPISFSQYKSVYKSEVLRLSSTLSSNVDKNSKNVRDRKDNWYIDNNFTNLKREMDILPNGNPDTFGKLVNNDMTVEEKMDLMPEEEDDIVRKDFVDGKVGSTRLSTKQYADLIKKYLAEKKLVKAIDVLEVKMLKEDHVKPENYIYNLIIDGCAKVGYTKKAFKLYNDMKKRDMKVTGATYTSLFNACALSPVSGDGLNRAHHLREFIIERQILLNRSNYHSMMKAFGRCGDLVTVFSIVDEMISKDIPLKPDTFCFLLQACINDQQDGFRHAIMVWQKMRERKVKPTIYCYNLMLRSARDCGVRDPLMLTQDLKFISNIGNKDGESIKLLRDNHGRESTSLPAINNSSNLPIPASLPNLLAEKPVMGTVIAIKNITKPKHRLMFLGGCNGFLSQMKLDSVEPDVKTITLLLDLLPSTIQAEQELIETFEKSLDIDFFNMLIKKRVMRHDYSSAKDVLNLISKRKLTPNLVTFGVLSMSCRCTEDTVQFLQDLTSAGFRPNMEMLGGLLCAARHSWNADVVMMIMDIVLQEELKVSDIFLHHLEKFRDYTAKQIELKAQGLPYHFKIDNASYLNAYDRFTVKYKIWLKFIEKDSNNSIHPWNQFKKTALPTKLKKAESV